MKADLVCTQKRGDKGVMFLYDNPNIRKEELKFLINQGGFKKETNKNTSGFLYTAYLPDTSDGKWEAFVCLSFKR